MRSATVAPPVADKKRERRWSCISVVLGGRSMGDVLQRGTRDKPRLFVRYPRYPRYVRYPRHLRHLVTGWLALAAASGCAPRWVNAVNVRVVSQTEGQRVDLTVTGDRSPPSCEILGSEVRATVDGETLRVRGRGGLYRSTMISGVELTPPHECSPMAWFESLQLPPSPPGTPTTIVIEDGPRKLELTAMNVRALHRVEVVGPSESAPGTTVTVRVTPEGDPPLPPSDTMEIDLYNPKARVVVVPAKQIRLHGRLASFVLPALPPGRYKLTFRVSEAPLRVTRCLGVPACNVTDSPLPTKPRSPCDERRHRARRGRPCQRGRVRVVSACGRAPARGRRRRAGRPRPGCAGGGRGAAGRARGPPPAPRIRRTGWPGPGRPPTRTASCAGIGRFATTNCGKNAA